MRLASGGRVQIDRNYWGLDINIYCRRGAKDSGLCMYPHDGNPKAYGDQQRSVRTHLIGVTLVEGVGRGWWLGHRIADGQSDPMEFSGFPNFSVCWDELIVQHILLQRIWFLSQRMQPSPVGRLRFQTPERASRVSLGGLKSQPADGRRLYPQATGSWAHALCCFSFSCSLDLSTSYFYVLPPRVEENGILYEKTCYCESKEDDVPELCDESPNQLIFPGMDRNLKPVDVAHVQTRKRRDVSRSDKISDGDYEYFAEPYWMKRSSRDHQRLKRQGTPLPVPQENATKYCTEKLVESHVGKFCAKLGINVHGFVNVCSADIMASMSRFPDGFTYPK